MQDTKVTCVFVVGASRGQNGLVLPTLPIGSASVLTKLQSTLNWAGQRGNPVLASVQCTSGLILNPVVGRVLIVGLMTLDFRSLIEQLSQQRASLATIHHEYLVVAEACAWSAYSAEQLQSDLRLLRLSDVMKVVGTFEEARSAPQLVGR